MPSDTPLVPADLVDAVPPEVRRRADLEVHSRNCRVCRHPARREIEALFLTWNDPKAVANKFDLGIAALRQHAAVFDLDRVRAEGIAVALARIVEARLRALDPASLTFEQTLELVDRITNLTQGGGFRVVDSPSGGPIRGEITYEERVRRGRARLGGGA